MARLESVAVAGYYPAPIDVVKSAASYISLDLPSRRWSTSGSEYIFRVIDPCAGDGEALNTLVSSMGIPDIHIALGAIELEGGRSSALQSRSWGFDQSHQVTALRADAFTVNVDDIKSNLLWLNPPYDTHKVWGRVEHKFLEHTSKFLAENGGLVFVVPYHALTSCAETLATHFTEVACYKFPEPHWDMFKQVVLFANRKERSSHPEPNVVSLIKCWGSDPACIPVLGSDATDYRLRISACLTSASPSDLRLDLRVKGFDELELMAAVELWRTRSGFVKGMGFPPSLDDIVGRVYPLASVPRPVHIASALAAGVFNGFVIEPNEGVNLPRLRIKGSFSKEFERVEDKLDSSGVKWGEIQIERPKLRVHILDLDTGLFHDVAMKSDPSGFPEPQVDGLTFGELLDNYGPSLMRGLVKACPVIYDPAVEPDPVPMPELKRPLYAAQANVVRTLDRLRRLKPDQGGILIGEVGCGKTATSLALFRMIGVHRLLVVCPPHLLQGWASEIDAVLPNAVVHVLSSISDVRAWFAAPADGVTTHVGVLSREKAKLTHGYGPSVETFVGKKSVQRDDGVQVSDVKLHACPKCGATKTEEEDRISGFGRKRSRCGAPVFSSKGNFSDKALKFLVNTLCYDNYEPATLSAIRYASPGLRHVLHVTDKSKAHRTWDTYKGEYSHRDHTENARPVARVLVSLLKRVSSLKSPKAAMLGELLASLVWAVPSVSDVLYGDMDAAEAMSSAGEDSAWSAPAKAIAMSFLQYGMSYPEIVRAIIVHERFADYVLDACSSTSRLDMYSVCSDREYMPTVTRKCDMLSNGTSSVVDVVAGSIEALRVLVSRLSVRVQYDYAICDEPLYTASSPRRYALADYIYANHKREYDGIIVDEAHEYKNPDSAQSFAAHKLIAGCGGYALEMSGSLMDGYAHSVFSNMRAVNPDFRAEYSRDDESQFVEKYGYHKQLVTMVDSKTRQPVEWGSSSRRVMTTTLSTKKIGIAPGVLPSFLVHWLLPNAVTLQKSDLSVDIPPRVDEAYFSTADGVLFDNYNSLLDTVTTLIKQYRREPLGAKLWSAMARVPTYLDLASCGNTESGDFVLSWPDGCEYAGEVIWSACAVDEILPKERDLLGLLRREVTAGRNVMVLVWHDRLQHRITKLIKDAGFKVVQLQSSKVSTGVRQQWITDNVVDVSAEVLVCQPVAVQTGLNNLVHFSTQVWVENPMVNPIIDRQATGRVDRIGQKTGTKIIRMVYGNTTQEKQHKLLLHKVGVSSTVDGLDAEDILAAAGVTNDMTAAMSVGRALYESIVQVED